MQEPPQVHAPPKREFDGQSALLLDELDDALDDDELDDALDDELDDEPAALLSPSPPPPAAPDSSNPAGAPPSPSASPKKSSTLSLSPSSAPAPVEMGTPPRTNTANTAIRLYRPLIHTTLTATFHGSFNRCRRAKRFL
jgi:hypothetical protein